LGAGTLVALGTGVASGALVGGTAVGGTDVAVAAGAAVGTLATGAAASSSPHAPIIGRTNSNIVRKITLVASALFFFIIPPSIGY